MDHKAYKAKGVVQELKTLILS